MNLEVWISGQLGNRLQYIGIIEMYHNSSLKSLAKRGEIEAWGLSVLWDTKDKIICHSPEVMETINVRKMQFPENREASRGI